jgi:rhodanese-related sulfurtransferase
MTSIVVVAALLCVFVIAMVTTVRRRAKRYLEANSIEPDELHALLNKGEVLLFDVRQPLDVLAYPEIIPGAIRIPPKDAAELSASYSRDEEAVLYCTGADDKTGVMVLGKVRALKFTRVKLLRGAPWEWRPPWSRPLFRSARRFAQRQLLRKADPARKARLLTW